jgi:hypothetical protein
LLLREIGGHLVEMSLRFEDAGVGLWRIAAKILRVRADNPAAPLPEV